MDAIALLMDEHRLILRVLDALDAFAGQMNAGGEDRAELGRFATFVREFADARHHGKEEDILFAAMIESGFPRDGGPIAVMLLDHEEGRNHLARLRGLAEQVAPWSEADRRTLANAATGYTSLLRAHIQKEDGVLYPLAKRHLAGAAMNRVDERCAAFEERRPDAFGPEALRALAEELISRHTPASR